MSELAATIREALAALAASDRNLMRFGAAQHRYTLDPPCTIADLPDDLAAFVAEIGSGGAGPGYGWFPIARALEHLIEPPPGVTAFRRALPICHLGCGYAAMVPLDGPARGEVWLDARALNLVTPVHATFTGGYLAWINALAHGTWPFDHIPPGKCAFASALSGYFGVIEREQGLDAGTLAGDALRDALAGLGAGAIRIAAESSAALFDTGDTVDPCLTCARLADALAADGLRRDVFAPGVPALPGR